LALVAQVTRDAQFRGMIVKRFCKRRMPAPDSRRAGKPSTQNVIILDIS
jgi:hypothetical protein